ncbi:MAG: type II toxin-antitoxin system RelE/ParE family toxin [Patescibacteria group bacterium]
MDKIEKFLQKLDNARREKIKLLLQQILLNQLADLEVKKLQGFEDLFRVRSGKIRIVFRKDESRNIPISVAFRDSVYKDLK